MSQYLDIYFLLNDRSIERVKDFIHQYSPDYEETAEDYPIPDYSSIPTKTFKNIFDLFDYLEKNDSYEYLVYLRNLNNNSTIKYVIIQFTNDEKVIIGVSVNGSDPSDIEADVLFQKLKRSVKADVGYITVEEPPPINSKEFLTLSQNRHIPSKV